MTKAGISKYLKKHYVHHHVSLTRGGCEATGCQNTLKSMGCVLRTLRKMRFNTPAAVQRSVFVSLLTTVILAQEREGRWARTCGPRREAPAAPRPVLCTIETMGGRGRTGAGAGGEIIQPPRITFLVLITCSLCIIFITFCQKYVNYIYIYI